MEIEVMKRDGRTVRFHTEKIQNAIEKGFNNVGTHSSEENVKKVLNRALNQIAASGMARIEIEKIQDQVEEAFVEEGFIEEYKAFKNSSSRLFFFPAASVNEDFGKLRD